MPPALAPKCSHVRLQLLLAQDIERLKARVGHLEESSSLGLSSLGRHPTTPAPQPSPNIITINVPSMGGGYQGPFSSTQDLQGSFNSRLQQGEQEQGQQEDEQEQGQEQQQQQQQQEYEQEEEQERLRLSSAWLEGALGEVSAPLALLVVQAGQGMKVAETGSDSSSNLTA